MAGQTELSFMSSDSRTTVYATLWEPEGEPVGVVQICHGMAEHIGRYAWLAGQLCAKGYVVCGDDHLGHGRSLPEGGTPVYFGEGNTWHTVVDDIYVPHQRIRPGYPDGPLCIMGHSMGSFLTRTYLIRYPGTVDGAVIMGTGFMTSAATAASLAVIHAECLRNGESRPSAVATKASFGIYNRRFAPNRTSMDWLSLNPDNVDTYLKDPLCQGNVSAGLFREMLSGIRFVCKEDNIRRMNHHTPILFISGAMDMVGDCSKGVERAAAAFRKAGMRDVTVKLYPELRHEILKEACHEQVYEDIDRWLESKLAAH